MKLSKRKKIILTLFLFLLLVQTATYLLFGSFNVAKAALQWTPEHIHFTEGTVFSWVCLELDKCENLTEQQKMELLEAFQENYKTVYKSESEIPKSLVHKDFNGNWSGYENGFSCNYSIVSHGPFWVKFRHEDLEGGLAGSWGNVYYVWLFGVWVPLLSETAIA